MDRKVRTMQRSKQEWRDMLRWLCIGLPFLAVVAKDMWFQSFLGNTAPYSPNLWAGICRVLPYLPLHAAAFLLLFGWSLLFRGRGRLIWNGIVGGVLNIIVMIDIIYVRAYNVLPSVVMLPMLQSSTGKQTVATILPTLLTWWDVFFFVDWIVWAVLLIVARRRGVLPHTAPRRRITATAITAVVSAIVLAAIPVLNTLGLCRGTYRRLFVTSDTLRQSQYVSFIGFHAMDIAAAIGGTVTTTSVQPEDEKLLQTFRDWQAEDTAVSSHAGQFAGKNVLLIQFESLESFVLDNAIDGQEITPTLNRLMKHSYAFTNLYEQVKSGNSADCDFLMMTGLLPTNKSYAFGSWPDNAYVSLPKLLETHGGYDTYYFHGAVNAIWNYEEMLDSGLGMNHIVMDYAQDDMLNGYLSDESFLRQTLEKWEQEPLAEPFYAHVVTCSSHIPCVVPDDFEGLTLPQAVADNPMGDYLQAIHYTDRELGRFLDELEARGTLDNTVIAIVGDHGGIHKYYPHWVDDLAEDEREEWFLKDGEEYTVPMLICDPSITDAHTVDVIGGQVDMLPTLLGLLGVKDDRTDRIFFGRDLFATTRSFAVTDDGTVFGYLPKEEVEIARSMYYLSDLLIRSDNVDGKEIA